MPFKSAELKDYAERLWGLGSVLSARQIAQMFRAGELRALMQELDSKLTKYEALLDEREELEARLAQGKAYRDKCLERISHYQAVWEEWARRRDAAFQEIEELQPLCEAYRWGTRTDEEAKAACERIKFLEEVVIPTAEREARKAEREREWWRSELERITGLLEEWSDRLAYVIDQIYLAAAYFQRLGISR